MILEYAGRQTGKTEKMVDLALRTNSYLVVANMEEEQRIRKLFKSCPKMITFHEFETKLYHPKGVKHFVIDNADMLLQFIASVPIIAVSMTAGNSAEQAYIDELVRINSPNAEF